jgi:tRNA A-37 threonylcarbamoyl transferase component Bud32
MGNEPTTDHEDDDRLHEAITAFEEARDAGLDPDPQEWLRRYPEVAGRLADFFAARNGLRKLATPLLPAAGGADPPPDIPGYQILEAIAPGGMGVVYKAQQRSTDSVVALKVIRADRLEGLSPKERRKAVERFITEAQAAARLEHGHIVKVYQVGEWQGRPFYTMRYVEGPSLAGLIEGGPLEPRRAAAYLEQVARGVHEAHQHGILHRDLKPANILVDARTDRPLVADFGLAKLLEAGQQRTHTQEVLGTPPYMSPEQAQGAGRVTVASDVYSLGATLYALLTGRPPFLGRTALETLRKVMEEDAVPPRQVQPAVPRDLETICLKCLEREPGRRYRSAEALADDLARWRAGEEIEARPLGAAGRALKWVKRRPAVAGLAGALALLLVAATGLSLYLATWALGERDDAIKARDREEGQRRRAERQAALTLLEQGLFHCEQEGAERGLLWLARAVGEARRAEAPDLDALARTQFAAWRRFLHPLKGVLSVREISPGAVFSPDGKTLLSIDRQGARDGPAQLWDLVTGKAMGPSLRHEDHSNVTVMAFSPDGRIALTGSMDDTARLWEVATGKALGRALQHRDEITAVAFSPDGKTVLTVSRDGTDHTARLWDWVTGRPLRLPLGHEDQVRAVAFSPDGKTVLTGSHDKTARLWEAATGKALGPPLQHEGNVVAVAFSPDGRTVLTGSDDKTARLWEVLPPIQAEPEVLLLYTQVVTGMELDEHGVIRILAADTWQARRRELERRGGPALP